MKNIDIVLAYSYNPFDKEFPFFYKVLYENNEIKNGSGFARNNLFNLILGASTYILKDIDEEANVKIYIQENDFVVFQLNKFIGNFKGTEEYISSDEIGDFIKITKKSNVVFLSIEKSIKHENSFREIFNNHF